MLTHNTVRLQPSLKTSTLRTVLVVGRPGRLVPDSAFNSLDYDVVVVEPLSRAYSQIKRVQPTLVVLCLAFGDIEECHLLSMLKLDAETASIPIRTCGVMDAETDESEEFEESEEDESNAFKNLPLSMN
jgi:PleD family two-component response regulator